MATERLTQIYVKLIVVLALIVVCTLCLWQKSIPLGLDLRGGSELIYRVRSEDLSQAEREDLVERTIAVISKRIDPEGSMELVIRKQGKDRFYIQLPNMGQEEARRFEDLIRRAGKLRFCLVNENTEDRERARQGERIPQHTPFLPAERDAKGRTVRWRKGNYEQLAELPPEAQDWFLVENRAHVTGQYLVNPHPTDDQTGMPAVAFRFKGKGRVLFERLTEQNLGRRLAIVLDEDLYSAPKIQSRISRDGIITGTFTVVEMDDLVATLRAGSLPADIELEWNNTVGAELGEDSIRAGFRASIIALVLVLVFMVLYYLLTGAIADFALVLNLLLVLGAMAAMQMVLTLPGIAGLVLTLGMAVDANVLINERIREERERGKTLRLAIRSGYERAFITIVDSNLTTLITALVLFGVGTESVRGFAKTLSIGIIISMFTAIWVTRAIVDLLIEIGWLKALRMLPVLARPHIPFSRIRKLTLVASAVCIVAGLTVFVQRCLSEKILDTDLTGGFRAEMELQDGIPIKEFRRRVRSIFQNKADVQTVWSAGEAHAKGDPTRFAIRIRKLTDSQKQEKMRKDLDAVLKKRGLAGSVVPEGPWAFSVQLSQGITEEAFREILWEARYHDSDTDKVILLDQKSSEFTILARTAALSEKRPDKELAEILDALEPFIVSQEVRLIKVGELVLSEPSKVAATEGPTRAYVPIQLGEACSTVAIREAIVREFLGGRRPEDLRVMGHGADAGSEVCREVAVRGPEADLRQIVSAGKSEIHVLSYTMPEPAELHIQLKSPQAETTIRDRLSEKGILCRRDKEGNLKGLVRTVIPAGVTGRRFALYMRPLSEDKAKEKIREDLIAAFRDELAASSAVVTVEPLDSSPDVPGHEELTKQGFRFFRLSLDRPLQLQEINGALSRADHPGAFLFDRALVQRIKAALGREDDPAVALDINKSEVATQKTSTAILKLSGTDAELTAAREAIVAAFASADPFRSVNTIGERVSKEMRNKAILAVLASCVAIIFYIWFRFGEVKFGLAAVVALVHDVLMTAGAVGVADALSGSAVGDLLGFSDIKVNVTMIAAFLTLIGYSINDTIVVFDRIRENMGGVKRRVDAGLVDMSVNQILSRTVLTSFTTFMVLMVLYIVGGPVIHGFAFVMAFGILVGTFSSIFIASPILIGWESFVVGLRKAGRIVTFRFS